MEITIELKEKFEAIMHELAKDNHNTNPKPFILSCMKIAYLLDREDKIEKYLRQRIKDLNDADAHFMEKAYDMLTMDFERSVYKNQSRSTTFGRQELESVLVFLKLPRFVTDLPTPPNQ